MNYTEAREYIENTQVRGSILGLERINKLCEILGNPQDDYKVIHLAGTNGKGSTLAYLSSVLKEAGFLVGTYYSPALSGLRDHYQVNSSLITEEEYAICMEEVARANDILTREMGESATAFEIETALSFVFFKRKKCDFAIIETGLGGLEDATNVIKNEFLYVFASISLDHMAILGNTVGQIAEQKAGIITCPAPVVIYDSQRESTEVILGKCKKLNNACYVTDKSQLSIRANQGRTVLDYKDYKNIEISLKGTFQRYNAILALEAICALKDLGVSISIDNVREGMKKAYWPFRFELICNEPQIYVDGAHNQDACDRLYETLTGEYSNIKMIFVIGMFKDKNYEYIINKMSPLASSIYTITVRDEQRALDKDIIRSIAGKSCKNVISCSSILEAARLSRSEAQMRIDNNEEALVLAFGSLSYLDEFKKCLSVSD